MTALNEDEIALLHEKQLAHVATVGPDGAPHVTPVWIDTDGVDILFNTARGRVKCRDIEANPTVAISVADRANDYRTLWVTGRAQLVDEGADEHIDKLAKKYLDADTYPFRRPDEQRVIVRVEVTSKLGRG